MAINKVRKKPSVGTRSAFQSLTEIRNALSTKIEDSLLDGKDAKKLGFDVFTADEAAKLNLPALAAGFRIPYFDFAGRQTKFWRFRYLESTKQGFAALTDKKELRYAQPKHTVNEIYMPPFVDWEALRKDTERPLVITEGELKAACATKHEYPTIGLGGVWCFKSNNSKFPILPQLADITWKGRAVYIAYDSDAVTNPMVIQAENALARELMLRGAEPYIVRIPPAKDGKKQGVDDYMLAHGAEPFRDLLDDAHEWRAAQELFALNEEVVYVKDPGIILVLKDLQRITPRAFVDHAFATRIYHETQYTDKGTKLVERSAPKEWLKWPARAEVAKVTYAPGEGKITERNELNVWRGWAVQPEANDTLSLWHELLSYIFKEDEEAREWFEQWAAYPLQNPGTKMYTSAVVWGKAHGTGKSLIGYILGSIYGRNFTEVTDEDLHANHNEWAENKQFVLGDEITGGDKRAVSERLKRMITRRSIRLNPKYVPSYEVPDCINYYFTSNQPDSFFLEDDDRRFFIWEVTGGALAQDFYDELDVELKNGRLGAAVFDHLLKLDVRGFNPRGHAMTTDAKKSMIDNGRSDLGMWVHTLKTDPDSVLRMGDAIINHALWRAEDLLNVFDPDGRKRVTANGLARELSRAGMNKAHHSPVATSKGRFLLWAVRDPERWCSAPTAEVGAQYDKERGAATRGEQRARDQFAKDKMKPKF